MIKWDHSGSSTVCYGDPKQESYKKAANFLGDTVEDWGCGTAWAKKFFKNYVGVDYSPHKNVDIVADLAEYTSDTDNILIRQVIEATPEWRDILENAKKSFNKRFCLVIGTPFVKKTRFGPRNPIVRADGKIEDGYIQEMYFNKQDILDFFPEGKYKLSEETVKTKQYYHQDWILYVEKVS